MKNYERPIVMINEDLAEGVYLNSGECYYFESNITQGPDLPAYHSTYVIAINGKHTATHHSGKRTVQLTFNKKVYNVTCGAEVILGEGTEVLTLTYTETEDAYHNNYDETIGLGNVYLTCDDNKGLSVLKTECIYCSEVCYTPGH